MDSLIVINQIPNKQTRIKEEGWIWNTSTVKKKNSGGRGARLEGLVTLKRHTPKRALLRINNRPHHGSSIFRNTKVPNRPIMLWTHIKGSQNTDAVLLHHEPPPRTPHHHHTHHQEQTQLMSETRHGRNHADWRERETREETTHCPMLTTNYPTGGEKRKLQRLWL